MVAILNLRYTAIKVTLVLLFTPVKSQLTRVTSVHQGQQYPQKIVPGLVNGMATKQSINSDSTPVMNLVGQSTDPQYMASLAEGYPRYYHDYGYGDPYYKGHGYFPGPYQKSPLTYFSNFDTALTALAFLSFTAFLLNMMMGFFDLGPPTQLRSKAEPMERTARSILTSSQNVMELPMGLHQKSMGKIPLFLCRLRNNCTSVTMRVTPESPATSGATDGYPEQNVIVATSKSKICAQIRKKCPLKPRRTIHKKDAKPPRFFSANRKINGMSDTSVTNKEMTVKTRI